MDGAPELLRLARILVHYPNVALPMTFHSHTGDSLAKPLSGFARVRHTFLKVYAVRRRIATVAATALTMGLGYHVVFGRNGLIVYQQKRMDARTLDGELHTLERENDRLKVHVGRLQNDPDAIEHQAREELHYTRAGEVIYTLPEPSHK
jgi:cell division protein FtsB